MSPITKSTSLIPNKTSASTVLPTKNARVLILLNPQGLLMYSEPNIPKKPMHIHGGRIGPTPGLATSVGVLTTGWLVNPLLTRLQPLNCILTLWVRTIAQLV